MNLTARLEHLPGFLPDACDASTSRALRGACVAPGQKRSSPFSVTLAKWRTAVLATHGEVEIRCLSGQLWITLPGDNRDIVLQAGESHVVPEAMREIVLSTVGCASPAVLELLPSSVARGGLRKLLQNMRPHFQLDIA